MAEPFTTTVKSVLGAAITVVCVWDDHHKGFVARCPFCLSGFLTKTGCHNPVCEAAPWATLESAKAHKAAAWAHWESEAKRRRNIAASRERIKLYRAEERAAQDAKIAEAKGRGQCIRCLIASGYRKTVKHRGPCPRSAAKGRAS